MYSRFKSIKGFDRKKLEDIQDSKVAVVGLGATGSVIAEHLARHGAELILVDRDYLEEKDLYTSNIYRPEQVERSVPKAKAAEEKLSSLVKIESQVEHLDSRNISILDDADIIIDGTDNLETRFLINDYSKREGKPWIYTAAIGEKGYSMFFEQKCFSCVFDEVSAGSLGTCESAGIMRETASIAASRSAWKAVRYLSGKEISEKLDMFPGDSLEVESSGCKVCVEGIYEHLESRRSTVNMCGENKYQLERDISDDAFERLRESGQVIADNDYLVRISIEDREFTLFSSGRAIVDAENRNRAEARFDQILGR